MKLILSNNFVTFNKISVINVNLYSLIISLNREKSLIISFTNYSTIIFYNTI